MNMRDRVVWLLVASFAGGVIAVEMIYVDEMSLNKIALCAIALGVLGFAFMKQRGDARSLRPARPHKKSRRAQAAQKD